MAKRLLDRQASLLEYLTSGGAVFGEPTRPFRARCRGWIPACLRLEAALFLRKANGEDRHDLSPHARRPGGSARLPHPGVRPGWSAVRHQPHLECTAISRFSCPGAGDANHQPRHSCRISQPASSPTLRPGLAREEPRKKCRSVRSGPRRQLASVAVQTPFSCGAPTISEAFSRTARKAARRQNVIRRSWWSCRRARSIRACSR